MKKKIVPKIYQPTNITQNYTLLFDIFSVKDLLLHSTEADDYFSRLIFVCKMANILSDNNIKHSEFILYLI